MRLSLPDVSINVIHTSSPPGYPVVCPPDGAEPPGPDQAQIAAGGRFSSRGGWERIVRANARFDESWIGGVIGVACLFAIPVFVLFAGLVFGVQ